MSDTKHGWITPRADGARARCGGPEVCGTCQTEKMHETMLTGVFGAAAPTPPASPQDPTLSRTGNTADHQEAFADGIDEGRRIERHNAAVRAGAQDARDWELCCDDCAGTGFILVKHQVAERKTDVQEFKEECECCEGRGFTIAYEDIPGIAKYVKSCRPAPASAQDDAKDERLFDDEAHVLVPIGLLGAACSAIDKKRDAPKTLAKLRRYTTGDLSSRHVHAPAAGDALDLDRLRRIAWLIGSIFVHGDFKAETFNERELEKLLRENGTFWDSLEQFDAALAASQQQEG